MRGPIKKWVNTPRLNRQYNSLNEPIVYFFYMHYPPIKILFRILLSIAAIEFEE